MYKTIRLEVLLITLIIFFGLPLESTAQKEYQEGYVITNVSDTLYGLIKDRKAGSFGKLYKKIKFRGDKGRSKYGPNEIKAYKQGQNIFESIWLNETGYFLSQKYTSAPNSGDRQFLKVVSKGYLTYYQLEFTDGESDFIDAIDLFKKEDGNVLIRVTQGIFGLKRKSLIRFFNDCPPLIEKIQKNEVKYPAEVANFYNSWKSKQL